MFIKREQETQIVSALSELAELRNRTRKRFNPSIMHASPPWRM